MGTCLNMKGYSASERGLHTTFRAASSCTRRVLDLQGVPQTLHFGRHEEALARAEQKE